VLGLEFRVERTGGMLLDQIMNIQLSLVSDNISLCLLQFWYIIKCNIFSIVFFQNFQLLCLPVFVCLQL